MWAKTVILNYQYKVGGVQKKQNGAKD